jgi:hypothetical protein
MIMNPNNKMIAGLAINQPVMLSNRREELGRFGFSLFVVDMAEFVIFSTSFISSQYFGINWSRTLFL